MKKPFRLLAMIVAFLMLQAPPFQGSAPAEASVTAGIDYRDGRIKISVDERPLEDVVEEVARKTGVRVIDNHPSREAVSMHLDYLPVAASLQRLLQGRDYVFFYRAGKAGEEPILTQVVVLPKTGGRVTAGPAEEAPATTAEAETEFQESNFSNAGLEQILEDVGTQEIDIENTITNALQQIHEMAPLHTPETRREDSQQAHAGNPVVGAMVPYGSVPPGSASGTAATGPGNRSASQQEASSPSSLTENIQNTDSSNPTDPSESPPDGDGPAEIDFDPLAQFRQLLEDIQEAAQNVPETTDNPL